MRIIRIMLIISTPNIFHIQNESETNHSYQSIDAFIASQEYFKYSL